MIKEKAKIVNELINKRRFIMLDKLTQDGYKSRLDTLNSLMEKIRVCIVSYSVLKNNGLEIQKLTSVDGLLGKIKMVQENFKNDEQSILVANSLIQITNYINTFTNEMKDKMLITWDNYIRLKMTAVENSELLNVLGKINSFKNDVSQLLALRSEILNSRCNLPTTKQQITDIDSKSERIKAIFGKLNSDEIPIEVITFLKNSVTNNGAALHLLNEKVIKWLTNNDLLRQFKIIHIT